MKLSFITLLVTSLFQACVWLALLSADPFGMSTAADRASENVFLRLYPILYPGAWRDQIQVVMIDEDQLPLPIGEAASGEWPLAFEDHAALIQRVLAFQPKAVFVDVLFDTQKGRDPGTFAALLRDLPPGEPLVFASYRDPRKQQRVIEPLRALPHTGNGALNGFVELTAPANHYQLRDENGRLSAAAALYNATFDPAQGGTKLGRNAPADMLLAWGNTVTRADARFSECAPILDTAASRWAAFVTAVRAGVERAFDSDARRAAGHWERLQPCPYHSETAAREVFTGAEATLSAKFKGAYVFIGASISGSGDLVTSPVHGQLPGVYLHAMALDNLLTFRGTPLTTSGFAWIPQVALVFLCTLLGSVFFANREVAGTRGAAAAELGLRAVLWAGFAALVALLLLAFLIGFNWAPYHWGSVLAVAGVVFFAGAGKALSVLVRGHPASNREA